MSSAVGLRVIDVSVVLGGVQILEDVNFEVRQGESLGIIGPNGAGKTTVINVICGLVVPVRGEVWMADTKLTGQRVYRMRGHGIGRSFQTTQYFHDLTCLELVSLATAPNSSFGAIRFRGHRRPDRKTVEALEMLHLTDFAEHPLHELSTAVQKLVDMARAVASGDTLLLLDEPTSGVSQSDRAVIANALKSLRDSGRTIVMIDHDPAFVVANSDRLMAMNFGRVLRVGTPTEVMQDDEVRRSYLGEMTAD